MLHHNEYLLLLYRVMLDHLEKLDLLATMDLR